MKKQLYFPTTLLLLFLGMAMTLNAQQEPEFALNPELFGLDEDPNPDENTTVRLVDIDSDDTLEAFVFILNSSPPTVKISYYENSGSNAFPAFVPADHSPFNLYESPSIWPSNFVDIDGDGDLDMTYYEFSFNVPLRILFNIGDTVPLYENFPQFNPFDIELPVDSGNTIDGVRPVFSDLDQDCDLDLMYGGLFNGQPDDGYYFSENIGTFYDPSYDVPVKNDYGILYPGGNYNVSTSVDLDCDGDLDLYTLIANPTVKIWYYENTPNVDGTAQFGSPQPWYPLDAEDFRFIPVSGTFWDYGGDGDLDLICGGSQGIFFWENISPPGNCNYSFPTARFSYTQEDPELTFTDQSAGNPTDWFWTFGDGETSTEQNPAHIYSQSGDYQICLEVSNEYGCNGICKEVTEVIGNTRENRNTYSISLAPNPVQEVLLLTLESKEVLKNVGLEIFDPMGKPVFAIDLGTVSGELSETLDVSQLSPGLYLLKVYLGENVLTRKFVKTGN